MQILESFFIFFQSVRLFVSKKPWESALFSLRVDDYAADAFLQMDPSCLPQLLPH